jgi:hypothetical protein
VGPEVALKFAEETELSMSESNMESTLLKSQLALQAL